MEMPAGEAPRQLPPGFRFHPTDEELVLQYLRRKALSRPLPASVIPVVHTAAMPDPWDLPGACTDIQTFLHTLYACMFSEVDFVAGFFIDCCRRE
jgi:hypothetical protein